jgi:Tol biopolymer transport system component
MARRSLLRHPAALAGLGLVAVALVVSLTGRLFAPRTEAAKRTVISGQSGRRWAAVSPDGRWLAYSRRERAGGEFHVYVSALDGSGERRLTSGAGSDIAPVWSPDGAQLAFARQQEETAQCMVLPVAGGEPRPVGACTAQPGVVLPLPVVTWSREGRSLIASVPVAGGPAALELVPLDGSAPRRLTTPPESSAGDFTPALSFTGEQLAFVRRMASGADLFVTNPQGAPARQLTYDGSAIRGVTWTASGDLLYASTRGNRSRLWRVPASGGTPHEVQGAGQGAEFPAAARSVSRLVYGESRPVSSVWQVETGRDGAAPVLLLRSAGGEWAPEWSPDGKRIANLSSQSGVTGIWISDASGANRVQVARLEGMAPGRPRWSPDGRVLLFDAGGALYTVPASGGTPRKLPIEGGRAPVWSSDGKSIYYSAGAQIWKADGDGANPQALAIAGGGMAEAAESLDGSTFWFQRGRAIWRMPAAGGEGREAVLPRSRRAGDSTLQAVTGGICYTESSEDGDQMLVTCADQETLRTSTLARLEQASPRTGISISPDRRCVLYTRTSQEESSLLLLENVR